MQSFLARAPWLLALTSACAASEPPAAVAKPEAPWTVPESGPTAAELEKLGHDGYLWGYAIVENYKAIFAFNVNSQGPEYKGQLNQILSTARVFIPADQAVVTPNSDTLYSFATLDLRAEPQVLTVPTIEKNRYYSLQFVDGYTHDFAYVGTRATGNKPGKYLVVGPHFVGEKPSGIDAMIEAETELVLVVYRTQIYGEKDLERVKKIQSGYLVTPLHEFEGTAPPPPPPPIVFPAWEANAARELTFFELLDFLLDFMPSHPDDEGMRRQLSSLGVGAPGKLDVGNWPDKQRAALSAGATSAQKELAELTFDKHFLGPAREVTSADLFGTRAFLGGDVRRRNVGAKLGIYGNAREEVLSPVYKTDGQGQPLDGAQKSYSLRFPPGALPPVRAFWSLTIYDAATQLLVDSPIKRYAIQSSMLPGLKKDADGGLTLDLSRMLPARGREANWLPVPAGPFYSVLRLYVPEPAAWDGSWAPPPFTPLIHPELAAPGAPAPVGLTPAAATDTPSHL